MINDHRIARRVWKIQISMHVNFISSKDTGETRTIYVWSENVSIMWGIDTDDIIRELFRSYLKNYQEEEQIISGSKFNFENVELMDYKLYRVRLRRRGSYMKSPEWLLHKGATINPTNKNDDECLRWSTISALNYNKVMKKELMKTYLKKLNMKIKIFHHSKETGKILNKTVSQSLLMSYFHHKIVRRQRSYINQRIIISEKITHFC